MSRTTSRQLKIEMDLDIDLNSTAIGVQTFVDMINLRRMSDPPRCFAGLSGMFPVDGIVRRKGARESICVPVSCIRSILTLVRDAMGGLIETSNCILHLRRRWRDARCRCLDWRDGCRGPRSRVSLYAALVKRSVGAAASCTPRPENAPAFPRGRLVLDDALDYAASASTVASPVRKFSRSEPFVTTTLAPSRMSPSRIFSASGSCSSFCITRLSGRAP